MPSLLVRIKPSHLAQSRTVLRECHLQKRLRVPAFSVTVARDFPSGATFVSARTLNQAVTLPGLPLSD
jgi:hypothetical protein